jgi:integrase
MLSLGKYPDVPLTTARERLAVMRRMVAQGVDPSEQRKAEKAAQADTLEAITREFFELNAPTLAANTLERDKQAIARLLQYLGRRPISSISPADLLDALKRINDKSHSRLRAQQIFGRIARYAVATRRAERDVSVDVKGSLPAPEEESFPAVVKPPQVAALLRAVWGYQGNLPTAAALKLLAYLFTRPGEMRSARWSEFEDLAGDEPLWRIPDEHTKLRREHLVPLPHQSVRILREELHPLTGHGELVFPGLIPGRPISDATMGAALRRLGYSGDEMVPHGFRSIAGTLLNERGESPDLIELQLAHIDGTVRAIYNRALRLEERRAMLQRWADYLDRLRTKPAENQ